MIGNEILNFFLYDPYKNILITYHARVGVSAPKKKRSLNARLLESSRVHHQKGIDFFFYDTHDLMNNLLNCHTVW